MMKRLCLLVLVTGAAVTLSAHVVSPARLDLTFPGPAGTITLANGGGETNCTTNARILVTGDAVGVSPTSATYATPPTASTSFTVTPLKPGTATITVDWIAGTSTTCAGADDPKIPVEVKAATGGGGAVPATRADSNNGALQDPVSTDTGELYGYDTSPDLALRGPLPLAFRRYYGSYLRANGVTSALGTNWMHNFEVKLATAAGIATVTLFRGKAVRFTQSGGAWRLAGAEKWGYQLLNADGGAFRFLDPQQNLIYTFSPGGALTRIEDRNGNLFTVTPGASGPDQVSDGLGRTLRFTHTAGRLTRVEDQTGRGVQFAYTGETLTAVTDAGGKTSRYTYTESGGLAGLMVAETRPAGNRPYTQQFDAQGRVSRQSDSRGNTTTVAYANPSAGTATVNQPLGVTYQHTHQGGNLTQFRDAAGQSSTFGYDAFGRLARSTDRLGAASTLTYHDPSGYPASQTDAAGNTLRISYTRQSQGGFDFYLPARFDYPDGTAEARTYDGFGNLLNFTDRAGKQWTFTYNPRGQVLTATNPANGVTSFSYDSDGTLSAVRTPPGDTTRPGYDAQKRLSEINHPDGTSQRFSYDNRDNLVRAVDERANTTSALWNDNNQLVTLTDAAGANTSFAYDADDRPFGSVDPLGKAATLTYNENGRPRTFTNRAGNSFTYGYDNLNRLISATDPAGRGNTATYNQEGLLAAVRDALSRTWSFTSDRLRRTTRATTPLGENWDIAYDSMSRVTAVTNPLSQAERYRYDARGLRVNTDAPAGISVALARNDLGQISRITGPNGNTWTRSFDSMGRVTSVADPLNRSTTFTYDNRNRVSRATLPEGSEEFSYDPAGNMTRRRYSDGTDLQFTWDANNRLLTANGVALRYDPAGRMVSSNGLAIAWDDAGRMASVTYAAGKTVRYSYDNRGLLVRLTDWAAGATELGYNEARELVSITRPNGVSEQFTYDRNGRLAAIRTGRGGAPLSAITLQRDAAGKVISAERSTPEAPSGSLELAFDAAEQVVGFDYDRMGRVKRDGLRTYTWDLASRLSDYSGADGTAAFAYDGLGFRIRRTAASVTQDYVLSYAHALPSVAAVRSGGADLRYYIYLPNGTPLHSVDAASGARRFYHFDETGSTALLTDDAGSVTDTYSLTPYGETVSRTGTTDNPFTFQGAYGVMQEGSTGLFYMRARYYDSATARFLSPDPVPSLDPRGLNPYQYALNNPLGYADPTGLSPRTYQQEFLGGIEFEVARSVSLGVRYVHRSVPRVLEGSGALEVTLNRNFADNWGLFAGYRQPPPASQLPIPRFADTSTAGNYFTIVPCCTNLLFPYVTNQAGFDTGLAISATACDPFGTTPQSGTCTLNWYGAAFPATPTPAVDSGTVYTTLVASPLNNVTGGFSGYTIAVCRFQYAHGFAFISDVGARNLAMGYLALIIPDPPRSANPFPDMMSVDEPVH